MPEPGKHGGTDRSSATARPRAPFLFRQVAAERGSRGAGRGARVLCTSIRPRGCLPPRPRGAGTTARRRRPPSPRVWRPSPAGLLEFTNGLLRYSTELCHEHSKKSERRHGHGSMPDWREAECLQARLRLLAAAECPAFGPRACPGAVGAHASAADRANLDKLRAVAVLDVAPEFNFAGAAKGVCSHALCARTHPRMHARMHTHSHPRTSQRSSGTRCSPSARIAVVKPSRKMVALLQRATPTEERASRAPRHASASPKRRRTRRPCCNSSNGTLMLCAGASHLSPP